MNRFLLLFSLCLGMLLTASGCEKIAEAPPSLGDPVSAKAVQDEFSKVESQVNPFAAKKGDALMLLMNISADGPGNMQNVGMMKRIVTEKNETEEATEYKIQNVDYEFKNDQPQETRNEVCTMTLTTKITYTCPSWEDETKSEAPSSFEEARIRLNKLVNEKLKNSFSARASGDDDEVVERRYYGLKTAQEEVDPPQTVRDRENCSGLSPCKVHLTRIQFDEVENYASGKTVRKRWDYALTPDLIYLGTEGIDYETCLTQSMELQGRPVLIRQCLFVYDFLK